ncbi:hypothetical protein ABZY05_39325 [Streptomyces canus]|uniref:hypothetical protein n=1 Tax=Streptomyces canus TaxID=58343 RepID=UPI0033BE2A41
MPNKKEKKTGQLVHEIAYFPCHTAPGATLAELITAAGRRWMVEESFQVAKGQVGLDEHEVRKWCSWYRHTTVAMLAMAFLATVRSRHISPRPNPGPASALQDRTPDPRPPTVNEIRRLYDRIVLAPARTALTWLVMYWHRAPGTRPEPARATTAPALTHREPTGCSR